MEFKCDPKTGGPYTKPQQEKRREQVFELYFEKGHSALQIAKMLKVNRNTINSDIAYCCSELHSGEKSDYYRNFLDKQFTNLEFQKSRLRQELEKDPPLKEKLQLEKSITHIDLNIANLIVKINGSKKYCLL